MTLDKETLKQLKRYIESDTADNYRVLAGPEITQDEVSSIGKVLAGKCLTDCFDATSKAILCITDLSTFGLHDITTEHNFATILKNENYPSSTLKDVHRAAQTLEEKGRFIVVSVTPFKIRRNISKVLECNKIVNHKFFGDYIVVGEKRPLIRYSFNSDRFLLTELNSNKQIDRVLSFANKLFCMFNYSPDIDSLFIPYSEFFVCEKIDTGEIINFARYTWHLPGHFLPCMLAENVDSPGKHIELDDPEKFIYGEIFSPYISTSTGIRAYRELTKTMLKRFLEINTDVLFTTYNADNTKLKSLFMNKFGFKDSKIYLRYGNFGGVWGLLYGTKADSPDIAKRNFLMER